MLKEIIATFYALAVLLGSSLAVAGDVTPNVIKPLTPADRSAANKEVDQSLTKQLPSHSSESMLDMHEEQTQQMRRDAVNFVGNSLYISGSCLNDADPNSSIERLDYALSDTMIITGKWSRIVQGVSIESGLILGQALCSAFIVRNIQHHVLAAGSVSVGVLGMSDNSGRQVIKTIPNRVRIFYKSRADLNAALSQIDAYARYYINFFNPEIGPPSTYIETAYDIHRCSAGKPGKQINVKTCPKETKTLPVK